MPRNLLLKGSQSQKANRRLFATLHHGERTEKDIQFVVSFLSSELLFFQELGDDAKRAIASHSICQHVRPGATVVKNEDSALCLYLVWSGSGTVFRKGIEDPDNHLMTSGQTLTQVQRDTARTNRRLERMHSNGTSTVMKGDVFGEEGLLKRLDACQGVDIVRDMVPPGEASITVVAHPTHGMVCFVIDFLLFVNYIWPHRDSLCWAPSHCMDILAMKPKDRTDGNLELVRRFVARIPFFQQLSRKHQIDLCRVMGQEKHESTANHRVIFQEGWPGDMFYVIVSGVVSVHQRLDQNENNDNDNGNGDKNQSQDSPAFLTDVAQRFHHPSLLPFGPAVAELRHGDSFGEKALHASHALRNATIVCQSTSVLLMVVDRESYNKIIKPRRSGIVMNVASAMQAIRKVPKDRNDNDIDVLMPLISGLAFFKQLPTRVVRHLVQRIRMVEVSPQKIICEQGTHGETLHIILSGSCAVFQCNAEDLRRLRLTHKDTTKRRLSDGDWTSIPNKNQTWIRQSQMTRTRQLSGEAEITKRTDVEDGNDDDHDELLDHDLLYVTANSTPSWYGPCVINLLAGDSFGEKSVILAAPRNATVITRETTRMFVLEKHHYDVIAKLGNVISNPSHCIQSLSKTPVNRSENDIQKILGLFSQMTFFRQLPATSVHKLAEAAGYGVVDADTPIIIQGDVRCNSFYVILSGSVSVHVLPNDQTRPSAQTLREAAIVLPMTLHRAHVEANAIMAREVAEFGPDGDESMTEDELYIRHEHRVHLPFEVLHSDVLDNVDKHLGHCVTTLGTSDTFGELSIHSDRGGKSAAEQVEETSHNLSQSSIRVKEAEGQQQHHHHHHHRHRQHHPAGAGTGASASASAGIGAKEASGSSSTVKSGKEQKKPKRPSVMLKTRIQMMGMMHAQHHRTASVISREKTEFLIIDNTTFAELLAHRTINFEPELARRVLDKAPKSRTQDDIRILRELFEVIEFFRELPPSMLSALCEVIELREFHRDQYVYHRGDKADGMYVVLSGKISIHRASQGMDDEDHAFSSGTHKENKHWSLLHHTMMTVHALRSIPVEGKINALEAAARKKEETRRMSNVAPKKHEAHAAAATAPSMTKRKSNQIIMRRPSVSMGLKALVETEPHDGGSFAATASNTSATPATETKPPTSPKKQHSIIDTDPSFVSVASMGDVIGEKSLLSHSTRIVDLKVLSARTELLWICKEAFHRIIEAHVDELDFHSNVLHRLVRIATKKKESLRGRSDVIKKLCTVKGSTLKKKFQHMKEEELEILYKSFDAKFYENEEYIYHAGENVSLKNMYVIVTGSVYIIRKYEEMNKQGIIEQKEVVVRRLNSGESFGAEELLLNCPRQTFARCVGKTICLLLNQLSFQNIWKEIHDGGMSKMSMILSTSTYNALTTFQKYMVLSTGYSVHVHRRTVFKPRKTGITIVVNGECEVYQQHHTCSTVAVDHKRYRTSPIRTKRSTPKRKRPPSKFAQDEIEQVEPPALSSKTILGIVGSGFTMNDVISEKFSFKTRTDVQLIIVPHTTFLQHMTTSTKMKLKQARSTILNHLKERHNMLKLKKEHRNGLGSNTKGGGGGSSDGGGRSSGEGPSFPSLDEGTVSIPSKTSQTFAAALTSSNVVTQSTNFIPTQTSNNTLLLIPHAPTTTATRINYSKAAIRSDRRHNSILKTDRTTMRNSQHGRSSTSPPPQIAGALQSMSNQSYYMQERERERTKERDAGLFEERSIVRALSPRLLTSVMARKRHRRMKRGKPIPNVGKSRRYRLAKLFNRGPMEQGYSRIRRDRREDERKRGLELLSGGVTVRKETIPASIELFDSKNYFGPTTGKFF